MKEKKKWLRKKNYFPHSSAAAACFPWASSRHPTNEHTHKMREEEEGNNRRSNNLGRRREEEEEEEPRMWEISRLNGRRRRRIPPSFPRLFVFFVLLLASSVAGQQEGGGGGGFLWTNIQAADSGGGGDAVTRKTTILDSRPRQKRAKSRFQSRYTLPPPFLLPVRSKKSFSRLFFRYLSPLIFLPSFFLLFAPWEFDIIDLRERKEEEEEEEDRVRNLHWKFHPLFSPPPSFSPSAGSDSSLVHHRPPLTYSFWASTQDDALVLSSPPPYSPLPFSPTAVSGLRLQR